MRLPPLAWPGRGFDRERPSGLMSTKRGGDPAGLPEAVNAGPPPAQSPSAAWTSASAATAAVSARSTLGPKRTRSTPGCCTSRARSSSANPPSGPIRRSTPLAAVLPFCIACASDWRYLAASSQNTAGAVHRAGSDSARVSPVRRRLRCLTIPHWLGRLDDIGPHPLDVDPRDLGEAGQNRLQQYVTEPSSSRKKKTIASPSPYTLRSSRLRAAAGVVVVSCRCCSTVVTVFSLYVGLGVSDARDPPSSRYRPREPTAVSDFEPNPLVRLLPGQERSPSSGGGATPRHRTRCPPRGGPSRPADVERRRLPSRGSLWTVGDPSERLRSRG